MAVRTLPTRALLACGLADTWTEAEARQWWTAHAATPNAAAYASAKAAALHLARCLALEGAEAGIRVNVVNPDVLPKARKASP